MTAPRRIHLALALAPWLGLSPVPAAAQDTTVTATLLKVVGEAVDGYRTGRPVYVVAAYQFPHSVHGVFSTKDSAMTAKPRAGRGFGVFGPYTAPVDGGGEMRYAMIACPHYTPTRYKCPTIDSAFTVPASQVDSVRVTVFASDGRSRTTTYQRTEMDALFFTLSAMDKFVLSYYGRLFGVGYASSIRDQIVRGFYGGRGYRP